MERKKFNINIIGKSSDQQKAEASEVLHRMLFEHFINLPAEAQKELKKLEYPKSEQEIKLIDLANQETSKLMQEAGVVSYNIPYENIHIVPSEIYKKVEKNKESSGITLLMEQTIFFKY